MGVAMEAYKTRPGFRYPPGVKLDNEGANFSVFSRHASGVELCLYEAPGSPAPFQVIRLDPENNRTFFFWHVYVEGIREGTCYTWRVDGPNNTKEAGFRFDKDKELLDPWARAVSVKSWDRRKASRPGENRQTAMRAIVVDDRYDWEGDQPLNHRLENTVIYELHVGGFTRNPSSGVTNPGTFSGVIEKIPYLKELGITDVELMPIMAFDDQDIHQGAAARGLRNYWGYSTHSFFCPHPGYCVFPESGTQRREFRDMVKALHKAGIGVIMDVVVNHTAEAGDQGPVINYKGLFNEIFYHLDPRDRSVYRDYTGCGNTVNCNHPLVTNLLVACMEYWVREMHVDGFRFDLASVLARGEDGSPMYNAPVLWSIEFSPILARTKIIAEAWDAGGLYQVGAFPGFRWAEWNGRYRDVVRRFVRGEKGLVGEMATRLSGSSDLYEHQGRLPINSINFITCHDGFTLHDLVSYNQKHNAANGQNSRDGTDDNFSWNCGVEGETEDPEILLARRRQAKNFMAILLLSQGVPMMLAGDEVLRSQKGNNNAYCQDNPLSWFHWDLIEKNQDMLRFVSRMIAFRKRHPNLMRRHFLRRICREGQRLSDVVWHGFKLNEPLWDDTDAQLLAYTLGAVTPDEEDLHIILNMAQKTFKMTLPQITGRAWYRAIDTWQPSPEDIVDKDHQTKIEMQTYMAQPRSVVVLESRPYGDVGSRSDPAQKTHLMAS
ncbi:MAG: glycogen debranching protein GlgX [Proteobacteria bacterium]|nr:glycogen debranching protein GlgX [Pseudomonadota bacterium]